MKRLVIIALLLCSLSSFATDLNVMFEVIKDVETNSNPLAVGDNGKAFGVVQIHKICVDDVNRIYGTDYEHSDMFNEACAKEVFVLYLTAGIDHYQVKHGKSPTENEIARMWNGGIYRGYLKNATNQYLRRYLIYREYYRQRKRKLT